MNRFNTRLGERYIFLLNFFFIIITLFLSCSKDKNNFTIKKVDFNTLKIEFKDDTSIIKTIIFYSPDCNACIEHFNKDYQKFFKIYSKKLSVYVIKDFCKSYNDYDSLYMLNLQKRYKIKLKLLCIDDTIKKYSFFNEKRYDNIINDIFSDEVEIITDNGIPLSIVSTNNKIMKKEIITDTNNYFIPISIYDYINFSKYENQ